ncbi:MAG: HutD family protein [Leucobacter sp.]
MQHTDHPPAGSDANALHRHWLRYRRFAELEGTPWANGLGVTTEIVSVSESARLLERLGLSTDTGWRLSVATLDQPAAFSKLPGLNRTFMPIGGDVVLAVDGVEHHIRSGTPHSFSGDAETELRVLSEPCRAVNFMSTGLGLGMSRSLPEHATPIALIALAPATSADSAGSIASAPVPAGPAEEEGANANGIAKFDLLIPSLAEESHAETRAPGSAAVIFDLG